MLQVKSLCDGAWCTCKVSLNISVISTKFIDMVEKRKERMSRGGERNVIIMILLLLSYLVFYNCTMTLFTEGVLIKVVIQVKFQNRIGHHIIPMLTWFDGLPVSQFNF